MFEASLKEKLKRIFDFDKVSFDVPSESQEQEAIFIQVDNAHSQIKDGRQYARVNGRLRIFANSSKLPYGYFAKKIKESDQSDTKDFFFEPEQNVGTYLNITERSMGFVYFFDSQYDPAIGTITSIETEVSYS